MRLSTRKILTFVALFLGVFSSLAKAHDLPLMDLDLAGIRPNCFVSPEPNFAPIRDASLSTKSEIDDSNSLNILLKSVGDASDQLSREWYQTGVPFQVGRSLAAWSSQSNAEELVTPPLPSETTPPFELSSQFRSRFSEVYMPYDFAVKDWRFGQFLQTENETESTESLSSRLIAPFKVNVKSVAMAFYVWENIECWASAEVASLDMVREYSETLTHFAFDKLEDSQFLFEEVATLIPHTDVRPLHVQPQLVSYELSTGQLVMLTLEQAKNWKLVASYQPEVIVKNIGKCPIVSYVQSTAVNFMSQQVDAIQSATQPWAEWLALMPISVREDQIAAQDVQNRR